jgi:hypothetical protein
MLAQIPLGREEQRGAIERPSVALDGADRKVQGILSRDPGKSIDPWPWHGHGSIEVAPELVAPLGGSVADDRPERDPTRIRRQKRFRKHCQLRSARAHLARQPCDLVETPLEVKARGGRLYDRCLEETHRVGMITARTSWVNAGTGSVVVAGGPDNIVLPPGSLAMDTERDSP